MSTPKRFNNVSVADVAQVAASAPPEVLLLAPRPARCGRRACRKWCCLRADSPARECFAECGPRRAVDFELGARPPSEQAPDGKLVILALKRPPGSHHRPAALRCQPAGAWAYARNPPHAGRYLSLAGSNRSARLRVQSLELAWAADGRELVHLQLTSSPQPPPRPPVAADTQSGAGETLLVVELACQQQAEPPAAPTTATLHLLALIDRPPAQQLNRTAPEPAAAGVLEPAPSQKPVESNAVEPTTSSVGERRPPAHRFHLFAALDQLELASKHQATLLLLLLASAALLILIYTLLCLCLRPAPAPSARPPIIRRRRRKSALQISQPFNLQMPVATRTRLEAMMKLPALPPPHSGTARERLVPSSGGGWRILGAVPHPALAATGGRRQPVCELVQPPQRACQVLMRPELRKQPSLLRAAHQLPAHLSRLGTLRVARNLRSAASSLARSRLRPLRERPTYRSNLHAIPEAPLEPKLQPPTGAEHRPRTRKESLPAADKDRHLESVVYDALSNECSHFVGKFESLSQFSPASATLFSRPNQDRLGATRRPATAAAAAVATGEPAPEAAENQSLAAQVSRSRILKQVKLHVKPALQSSSESSSSS